jgi:hypothetical protein
MRWRNVSFKQTLTFHKEIRCVFGDVSIQTIPLEDGHTVPNSGKRRANNKTTLPLPEGNSYCRKRHNARYPSKGEYDQPHSRSLKEKSVVAIGHVDNVGKSGNA